MFQAQIRSSTRFIGHAVLTTRARLQGGGGGPPPYIPALIFSDSRNSQYVPLVYH